MLDVPGSFPLHCSLPEIYFFFNFILIKVSLGLENNLKIKNMYYYFLLVCKYIVNMLP